MLEPRQILAALLFAAVLTVCGCDRKQEQATGQSEATAATGDDPTAHVPSGEPLVVVARVLEVPRPSPCTSQQTFAVPARYETVRVEDGDFDEQQFLVRTVCPERAREEGNAGPVSVGDMHRLHLDPTPYRTRRAVQWIPVRTDRAEP